MKKNWMIFVVGLNGLGKFWSNPNVDGASDAVTGTLTGLFLTNCASHKKAGRPV